MASGGKLKFDKYFIGLSLVNVIAKGTPKGSPVPVFKDIYSKTKEFTIPDGTNLIVVSGTNYVPRYFCTFDGGSGYIADDNVSKPSTNINPELSRIVASDFISGGTQIKFRYNDEIIDCVEFSSANQLSRSIIECMDKVCGVSIAAKETFTPILNNPSVNFNWNKDITSNEILKFGVYFGELLTGVFSLNSVTDAFSDILWKDKVAKFIMPCDPSFSGVDSFVITESDDVIPISNKFGPGAAASFFSNLLPLGIDYYSNLPNCIFKDIVETAISLNVTSVHLKKKQKAKPILYEYGIREILKLNTIDIEDSFAILGHIKRDIYSSEREYISNKIRNYPGIDSRLVDGLDNTITAFFCREISKLLMNDIVSMKVMRNILTQKNFIQANLNETAWKKGQVKFNIQNSGESRLEIIGSKASMTDLDASQGMINYILK